VVIGQKEIRGGGISLARAARGRGSLRGQAGPFFNDYIRKLLRITRLDKLFGIPDELSHDER
jgi:hypothetical protein